jgi:hypothetical protein
LRAQTILPEATCVEYLTVPNATKYIAHFSYLDTNAASSTLTPGSPINYFSPGTPTVTGQVAVFYPGYQSDVVKYLQDTANQTTWTLNGSTAVATPDTYTATSATPSPRCEPNFIPAALSFSSPGTYTNQYLGQIDAGPPADPTLPVVTVAGASGPRISLSNITYIANDAANPGNSLNPNSIYATVTLSAQPEPSTFVPLRFLVNGWTIAKGILSIGYVGTTGTPDNTHIVLTPSTVSAIVGGTITLSATVTDTSTPTATPTGTVTFTDTVMGTATTIGTGPLIGGTATLPDALSSAGVHTLSAVYTPDDSAYFNPSSATSAANVTVHDEHVWLLNNVGTLNTLAHDGSPSSSGIGTAAPASSLGGVAFDATGRAWSITAGSNLLNVIDSDGTAAQTFSGGGLNGPSAIAVDGVGNIWIANSGGNSISLFSNSGIAVSGSSGLSGNGSIASPSAIAIDATGGLWVANRSANTVTKIIGGAVPVETPLASAVRDATVGTTP